MANDAAYLLFAKKRKVEQNFEGLGISSQDDNFCDTTVQGLGGCIWLVNGLLVTSVQLARTFVGTLLELLVLRRLLDEIEDLQTARRAGERSARFPGITLEKRTWSLSSAGARGQALAREAGSDMFYLRPHD